MLQNIIPPRLKSVLAKRPQGFRGAWRKRVLILCGFILALLVIGHLGIRFIVWPQIEKSKETVGKLIGARIGADVVMDNLQVSWTGIRPNFEIEGLRFNSPDKTHPLLEIQKISGELSWDSLYHLAPYFHQLNFQDAQIYAQRSKKGIITIAGIPIHNNPGDHAAENWLFSQNNIEVNDVKFIWEDQENKKPAAVINIQNFSLSNGIRNHQAILETTTPWTSGPLELKANFAHHIGGQVGNWRDWIGTVSWNLNELNLNQLSQVFKIPLNTLEGTLSSKGKLKLDNGKPDGGEAYVAADNLTIQLEAEEDAIALRRLETNLIQETEGGLISITTKTFAWRELGSPKTAALEILSPMTFRWKPPGADEEIKEFGFSSPKILVEDIALFALNLPLSKKVHQWIKASQAYGELQNLDIHWSENKSALSALKIPGGWFKSNKLNFNVSAQLINLSFLGINKTMPSVSNLSGFISGDQNQGSFSINSNDVEFDVNDFLVDSKIKLDRAKGKISWAKEKGNWAIDAKQLALSNPEINTTLNLHYVLAPSNKPDLMTLDMEFDKANLKTAYRYLPVGMSNDVKSYLKTAFDAGVIKKGSLHIKGDPNEVPFPKKNEGSFTLNLPIFDATFNPAPTAPGSEGLWSALTNVNGSIAMQNSNFTANVTQANYKQVVLSQFHAEIPNVSAKQLILSVDGKAEGEAAQILEYALASPFAKKQNKLVKTLQATGPIQLDLGLKLPLSGSAQTSIDIRLDLPGNKVQWAKLPPLENLKGKIRITDVNPEFENVTADFLGGSLKISSVPSTSDKKTFSVVGDISASFIKDYFLNILKTGSASMLEAMSGTAKYEGTLSFYKAGSETNLKIDLSNWASAAPVPAKKIKGAPMLGQVSFKTTPNNSGVTRFNWSGTIGELYSFQGDLNDNDELRYALGIGAPAVLTQKGFNLNLIASELNVDAWQDFLESKKNIASNIDDPTSNDLQLTAQVKKLTLAERLWQDINLSANNKNNIWQARINSPLIAGDIQYQAANETYLSGLISGHLSRLKVPDAQIMNSTSNALEKAGVKNTPEKSRLTPNAIPSLDLLIDDLNWSKAQLGEVKIKTLVTNNVLTIESIHSNNPQGSSKISGKWIGHTQKQTEHSTLNLDMEVKDAGQIIAHWSPQKSVEGGQGKLTANIDWDGPPYKPKYETLTGKVNLNLEKGRLLEVNTSGAKILDVLSLQSLFKFATLDLKGGLGNIVTKGTPFSSIYSNFDINNGIAETKQFTMNLDQARVAMSGQINIPNQTQDLRVTIFPTIDATAGSLAAFAINPIVGLGALVGQYLITNQINRNLQSDYLVQGSWENPEVIPLDQKGQPLDTKTLGTIRSKDLLKEQSKPESGNSQAIPTRAAPSAVIPNNSPN